MCPFAFCLSTCIPAIRLCSQSQNRTKFLHEKHPLEGHWIANHFSREISGSSGSTELSQLLGKTINPGSGPPGVFLPLTSYSKLSFEIEQFIHSGQFIHSNQLRTTIFIYLKMLDIERIKCKGSFFLIEIPFWVISFRNHFIPGFTEPWAIEEGWVWWTFEDGRQFFKDVTLRSFSHWVELGNELEAPMKLTAVEMEPKCLFLRLALDRTKLFVIPMFLFLS